ncbi:MAG: NACHT domain-containing protein [Rhodopirellula sp. JB044]|uniref:NACHT domain-containing protein n=1 Tax=Rhodopirellula sp. JB044 TaxID=3342844 RepID=UPI00370BD466
MNTNCQGTFRRAFAYLSACETGTDATWNGPLDEESVRHRVETLAVLLHVVPPQCLMHLDAITDRWVARFGEEGRPDAVQLRQVARSFLQEHFALRPAIDVHAAISRFLQQGFADGSTTAAENSAMESKRVREGDRHLEIGLRCWLEQICTAARWTHLPSAVPGELAEPLDRMYVELYACEQTGRSDPTFEDPRLDVSAIASRTFRRSVIVGGPGSGKSTLMQSTAIAVTRGRLRDFDMAFVVNLDEYARSLEEHPGRTIGEFFFATLECDGLDEEIAVDRFRELASLHDRFLWLYDGWDEVPESLRGVIAERIEEESRYCVTLITSRPSGLPRLLCDESHVGTYRLDRLRPDESRALATNLLRGRFPSADVESILAAVLSSSELKEYACNPYLLSLLVIYLADAKVSRGQINLGEVLQQIVGWVRKRENSKLPIAGSLTTEHVRAVSRMAYESWFKSQSRRDVYFGCDLEWRVERVGLSEVPILRSRFFDRADTVVDEYRFLHDSFQKFFVAMFVVEDLHEEEQAGFIDQAMVSVKQFEILCYAAALPGAFREVCYRSMESWYAKEDRFHQITIRIGRIATIAGWTSDRSKKLVPSLCKRLFHVVLQNADSPVTAQAVKVLAELDPRYLLKAANCRSDLDLRVLRLIVEHAPPELVCEYGLNEWMCDRSEPSGLLGSPPGLRESLKGNVPNGPTTLLDCGERDRLVIRIASFAPDHPETVNSLGRLVGQPYRYGAVVVSAIARDECVKQSTRTLAMDALRSSSDRNVLKRLAGREGVAFANGTVRSLLKLSASRSIWLDRQWLEERISRTTRGDERRLALAAYCQTVSRRSHKEMQCKRRFLARLTVDALQNTDRVLLCELSQMVEGASRVGTFLADGEVVGELVHSMRRLVRHDESLDMLLTEAATALCGEGGTPDEWVKWVALLDDASEAFRETSDPQRRRCLDGLVQRLGRRLAKWDPAQLLQRAANNESLVAVLESFAVRSHGLVYSDRIIDAEGNEIACRVEGPLSTVQFSTPEAIAKIAQELPPRQRSDFLSYWHVVSEGGDQHDAVDRETIHRVICTVMDSQYETSLGEHLNACYDDGRPPSFSSWKKNLTRVIERYRHDPELLAHLNQIGLGNKRVKPR